MKHRFTDYLIVKDDFFNNPNSVYELSLKQEYSKSEIYPGLRTENLLDSTDSDTRNFALFCAQRIKFDVFAGLTSFMLDIRFHINEPFDDTAANTGWIHADPSDLAGLVYLTPNEESFDHGTSIFIKKSEEDFSQLDFTSRLNFNLKNDVTPEYINELKDNWSNFTETIRVGNKYNRMVAYDAKSYHRPNRYNTASGEPRRSLLFFIQGFGYTESFNPNILKWKDQ